MFLFTIHCVKICLRKDSLMVFFRKGLVQQSQSIQVWVKVAQMFLKTHGRFPEHLSLKVMVLMFFHQVFQMHFVIFAKMILSFL